MTAWTQRGKLYLWRYIDSPGGYRGGHLTADQAGCESLDALLTQFIETPRSRRARVRVTRPTAAILGVPNAQGGRARWAAPKELQIELFEETPPEMWQFTTKGERYELLAGRDRLQELRDAVRGILKGQGDFALGPEEGSDSEWDAMCLNIWWMP